MRLTIITVCFNAEKVIKNTIESVLKQSEKIYEYIFIDGASTDNTVSIIESYRGAFEKDNIRFIVKSEPDKGISDAFNKGIAISTGDLIGLLNADDELNKDCVKRLTDNYSGKESDIYYGDCIWRDSRGDAYKKPGHSMKRLLYNMILFHPATFVRKSCYETVGMFDVSYKYCMDKHFLYRCFLLKKNFCYINAPLVIFKAGGVSDTHAREVYQEGTRMAVEFGEPRFKALGIEVYKIIRHFVIGVVKKTKIYSKIKYM